ncbi:1,8-cineole synthase [Trema orientale]|uniref:1,8-cineole synthase n=1 Tax=Trema orientale TaxID=63057 RepID=A0A2P5E8Q9_TREOI|nr:1,8-cineole synthase [Trema orientale]
MGAMESGYKTQTTIAPLILRNLVSSVFVYADNSFFSLAEKHKLLELIRSILIASVLFFLRLIPYLNPNDYYPFFHSRSPSKRGAYTHAPTLADGGGGGGGGGGGEGSGIGRALSQLLSITSDIPVSSRKYDVVRGLAEKIIEDNRREGSPALREVNRTVISAAFSRTLGRLEAVVVEKGPEDWAEGGRGNGNGVGPVEFRLNRVLRAARSIGEFVLTRVGRVREGANRSGISAEKLAAELIWLAEKMASCGFVGEAVWRWASASRLAWLAVSAEPRLQCSLVKLSAFLFKQSKHVDQKDGLESEKEEQQKQLKIQMLQSWLPLLCRASNGTDAPVLSASERAELERVLEEMIETLDEEQQEKVLTLWLHHFTSCSSSDWPNLHASYARWCDTARETLLLRQE